MTALAPPSGSQSPTSWLPVAQTARGVRKREAQAPRPLTKRDRGDTMRQDTTAVTFEEPRSDRRTFARPGGDGSDALPDDELDRVAATRRKTGMDVHDILVKEGLLSAADVQETFETMVEQDIFDLMAIRTGTYEFETEERAGPVPEGALFAEIGPILMEGARKTDEVAEMRRALGPEDAVLALTTARVEDDDRTHQGSQRESERPTG